MKTTPKAQRRISTVKWNVMLTLHGCPKHENVVHKSPRRPRKVLPSARNNCPAGCKPQLAGAYCPPLCAGFQQIHMLSRLNPYLLPSRRTEKRKSHIQNNTLTVSFKTKAVKLGLQCVRHRQKLTNSTATVTGQKEPRGFLESTAKHSIWSHECKALGSTWAGEINQLSFRWVLFLLKIQSHQGLAFIFSPPHSHLGHCSTFNQTVEQKGHMTHKQYMWKEGVIYLLIKLNWNISLGNTMF